MSLCNKSEGSKEGSPKKISAPCCSNSITFLSIVETELVDTAPYTFSISSFPSLLI